MAVSHLNFLNQTKNRSFLPFGTEWSYLFRGSLVQGCDIVYDGDDNSSSKDKILNYLTRAYNTAFGAPFEEIVLLKNHIQVPPNHILEIKPLSYW